MVTVEFDEETAEVLFSVVFVGFMAYWAWVEYSTLVEAAQESRLANSTATRNERRLQEIAEAVGVEEVNDELE